MNLNGVWQFQPGGEGDAVPTARKLSSEILVPFPVESALSGVMQHHDRLWYRRSFTVPAVWKNEQLKLHFGAVDYEAEVFVNGESAGLHRGGYEPFSLDITKYLRGSGPQELIVRAFDPTDKGGQPRGKQTLNPGFIMYTPISGIWQTVWLEPTDRTSIQDLRLTPDVDKSQIKITVNADGATSQTRATVSILDGSKIIKTLAMKPGVETAIALANPKLWSPDRPFLYDLKVALSDGKTPSDSVTSYFGMRKISVGMVGGVPRMLLNNKFVFQFGPLDQGYWPDGLYTAPTDAALKYDLEVTKQMGFNMTRKHIKIEPARWYHHADKLGLLVWQDMPSPNSYTDRPATLDKAAFEQQLRAVIAAHRNSPSIVMWAIFNENQARHDTRHLSDLAKSLDPTRLEMRDKRGLSAAVYTQLTDVEIEVNGLMTYDRLVKPDLTPIRQASRLAYPPPTYATLCATAEAAPQAWKYTFAKPSDGWASAGFDNSAWKAGRARSARRSRQLASGHRVVERRHLGASHLRCRQSDTLAFKNGGTINNYQNRALLPEAQRAVIPNATNVLAVHCRDNGGGQHLDVGIVRRIPGVK